MSALVKCFDEFKSIVFAGCRRNSELTILEPRVILNTMMKQIPRIVSGGQSGADRAAQGSQIICGTRRDHFPVVTLQ
jgi:hypothetical protein